MLTQRMNENCIVKIIKDQICEKPIGLSVNYTTLLFLGLLLF